MSKNKVSFFQKHTIEVVEGEGVHQFPYHTHESYLVGVMKSGEARFAIGSRLYLLTEGMTYLVPPNVGISITPVKPYSYLTICIKNEKKADFGQYMPEPAVMQGLREAILTLCTRFTRDELTEEEFIHQLCGILALRIHKEEFSKKYSGDAVQLAAKYIKNHVNDKFMLDHLAQTVHMSKYHLVRMFKNEMGITPKQYDQQCKIRQVKKSILCGDAETDIAIDLNFSNQSHLCCMFKRYMGISPKNYLHSVQMSAII